MVMTPVVLCLSKSGEATAARIAAVLQAPVHGRNGRVSNADAFFDNALDHVRTLFAAGTPIVGVCAAGILIRAVAPLLNDKRTEPPVLAVPDDGSSVIPLLGGHHGANRLARRIAEGLHIHAAVTTAGDVAMGVALDEPPPGYRLANPGDAKDAMAAMLAGAGVSVSGENIWGIEADEAGAVKLVVSEAPVEAQPLTLVYHPQKFALGLGCARRCDPAEMWDLVTKTLAEYKIAEGAIACVASLDLKADEPAMINTARRLGVPYRVFTAGELEAQAGRLARPSDVVFAEVGCHGVCEGAALAAGGANGVLVVAKQKTATATCAVVRADQLITEMPGRSRGKLSVIGIGPGSPLGARRKPRLWWRKRMNWSVTACTSTCSVPWHMAKPARISRWAARKDRCRYALEQAGKGKNVALICSGDAGIYAMGALVFELLDRAPDQRGISDAARRVEVQAAPGVSALQAAAARAGAPLGHDFCVISLSDLLTPREDIVKRLRAAATGDFVIAFYNPVSMRRRTLLAEARDILLQHRPADTPVMLARSLGRPEELIRYRRLDELQADEVDMLTVVLVGSSQSRLAQLGEGPRMYTPRGYARKMDGDLAS